MKQRQYTTTILTAEDGMYITQATDVDIASRIVAKEIAVGDGVTPQDYKEISTEEAKSIRKLQEIDNAPTKDRNKTESILARINKRLKQ